MAWLEPQIRDPAIRARLSANEATQLQELGTLLTDAMLHRAVTINAAVESARDVIVNLSRLPEYLTLALRDDTDATTDADWLDCSPIAKATASACTAESRRSCSRRPARWRPTTGRASR